MEAQSKQMNLKGKKRERRAKGTHRKPREQGGPRRQHQGEWTELRFMSEAARRGFTVLRPLSRGSVYDVMLDRAQRFLRVQVKSAGRPRKLPGVGRGTIYAFNTRRHNRAYRPHDLDFYALYIVPRDAWYIIPYSAIGPVQILCIHPDKPKHKLERYRGAWHLLR
jgi:PD-(D/E)XK endonuclease